MRKHGGNGTLQDGVTPSPELIRRYIDAVTIYDESALAQYEGTIQDFLFPEFSVPVDEAVFVSIMLPLIKLQGFIVVVTLGLLNPYCPVEVLSVACRDSRREYRRVAAQHKNCREEDRVYAALMEGERTG